MAEEDLGHAPRGARGMVPRGPEVGEGELRERSLEVGVGEEDLGTQRLKVGG